MITLIDNICQTFAMILKNACFYGRRLMIEKFCVKSIFKKELFCNPNFYTASLKAARAAFPANMTLLLPPKMPPAETGETPCSLDRRGERSQ